MGSHCFGLVQEKIDDYLYNYCVYHASFVATIQCFSCLLVTRSVLRGWTGCDWEDEGSEKEGKWKPSNHTLHPIACAQ